ncbi:alpha/beta hydrolase [Novosphingobium sp.]|uniref:alpha/beta hydrolase n=1 Tax=Novosphingobium sp. TaxID=1874826 RepID=UPI0027377C0F|nr:alpha/beta hydrolase [Novosphingobium sp.]MDP3907613.1 alpha/beta hydrolase [Novosphingobium sp.]
MKHSLKTVAYFHGMPGGPGEWAANAPAQLVGKVALPDRNQPSFDSAGFAASLPQGAILIGFSLGAYAALQVAAAAGERVGALHLVSPAAPLQLGDFLPQMQGGKLFWLAANHPSWFGMVSRAQSWVAWKTPGFMLNRLMSGAAGDDRGLIRDPAWRAAMAETLRTGIGFSATGYVSEIRRYVEDWRDTLAQVQAPVTIWQGDADNWTPPAMAQALAKALPGDVTTVMLPGASHYSALQAALARIEL